MSCCFFLWDILLWACGFLGGFVCWFFLGLFGFGVRFCLFVCFRCFLKRDVDEVI